MFSFIFRLVLLRYLFSIRLNISLIIWFIKSIVPWNLHSFTPGFFSSIINIDQLKSSGILPLLYILFITFVNVSLPKSCKAVRMSITISSGRVGLFFFILISADLTSNFTITEISVLLCIVDCYHGRVCLCLHHISMVLFSFNNNIVLVLDFMHPNIALVVISFSHQFFYLSSFACLLPYFWCFFSFFNLIYSPLYLAAICYLFFIGSRFSPVSHFLRSCLSFLRKAFLLYSHFEFLICSKAA